MNVSEIHLRPWPSPLVHRAGRRSGKTDRGPGAPPLRSLLPWNAQRRSLPSRTQVIHLLRFCCPPLATGLCCPPLATAGGALRVVSAFDG